MRDLERELRELSSAIMVPPTPDLAGAAHTRLRTTRPAESWPRRPVVLALVVAIVLVAGLAVSPARTAILRFFGIGAVQIELAALAPEIAKKIVGGSTNTRLVDIRGSTGPGIWIEGAPHVVVLADAPPRLVGNTLGWVHEGRTLRTEGAAELHDALRIAESMR